MYRSIIMAFIRVSLLNRALETNLSAYNGKFLMINNTYNLSRCIIWLLFPFSKVSNSGYIRIRQLWKDLLRYKNWNLLAPPLVPHKRKYSSAPLMWLIQARGYTVYTMFELVSLWFITQSSYRLIQPTIKVEFRP